MPFLDRREAGRRLAEPLRGVGSAQVVVLGIARGGVPVASEVAAALGVPLDIVVVRKLLVPQRPWQVFGAIAEDGVRVIDPRIVARAFLGTSERLQMESEQRELLRASVVRYRRDHPRRSWQGVTAVVVDDGVATGATAYAACVLARARGAARVVFATPVGYGPPLRVLNTVADDLLCLENPRLFGSIRPWYRDFAAVSETQVCALLDRTNSLVPTTVSADSR